MQTTLSSPQLTIQINHFGAELCSIKNNAGTEFIWQADKQVWARHAPVLFPIVGKLKENQFIFENSSYSLGQHGFARDRNFTLIKSDAGSCTFELLPDPDSKKNYPFDFVLRIHYQLQNTTLLTSYTIINPTSEPMLFNIGAHPGFNCPLLPNERLEDYYFEFEKPEYSLTELSNGLRIDATKNLATENKRLFLSKQLFDNDALVFEKNQINAISLCSSVSAHKIIMKCEGWPYFGIWSKPGAPFVCLEPWYGIADKEQATQQLTEKEGMIALAAREEFNCSFSITIV